MAGTFNLFVVQSPLQLLMAQIARDALCSGEKNRLLMVTMLGADGPDARQMGSVIDDGWNATHLVCHAKVRGLVRTLARVRSTLALVLRWGMPAKVIVGDDRNPWFRILGRFGASLTYVDDGAAALRMLRELRELGRADQVWPNGMPYAYSFFARDDDGPGLMRHSLAKLERPTSRIEATQLLIVGSKYGETGLMKQTEELAMIEGIIARFGRGHVEYVAHRHEQSAKLSRLAALGCEVRQLDMPLELDLLNRAVLPGQIVAGFSTTLFTCRALFPDIEYAAVRFPLRGVKEKRAQEISQVYDALAETGVPIIEASALSA